MGYICEEKWYSSWHHSASKMTMEAALSYKDWLFEPRVAFMFDEDGEIGGYYDN